MVDPLPAEALRWRCDPESLPFETTDDVESVAGVVGQAAAVEALRFGLECDARGQNIFVRGLVGTGRMTLVGRLLDELNPTCTTKQDRCYVHNFTQPDCPRLLSFPAGQARSFRRRLQELTEFIRTGLADTLNSEPIRVRREALLRREKEAIEKISRPFEDALKEADLALVSVQVGEVTQPAIYPVFDGKPVAPEEYEDLHEEGKIEKDQLEAFLERSESFQRRLEEVSSRVREIHRTNSSAIRNVYEEMTRAILGELARSIETAFPGDTVKRYLKELIDDVAENQIVAPPNEAAESLRLYGVNIILEHEDGVGCPIVIENTPSLPNLLGQVERHWGVGGPEPSDYRMIRAGSLLRADGGYLVLDARDVLSEPGAWKVLIRTLRTGCLEIVPPEFGNLHWQPSLKPEPIPVRLRVILLGDAHTYYVLDAVDADFSHLFKVLADFDSVIERDARSVENYAGVLARIIDEESLLPMSRGAVAAIAEHGARIAGARGKLTARFSRIADIAREASFLAAKQGEKLISADAVMETVRRTKRRAGLPSRKFQEYLKNGTIRVQTEGSVVGQINGLAVLHAGPIAYGFPARITASIGAGSAGIINIEGRAAMSGAIHTKGFHILGGLLRTLLQTDHPLAFSASLAFEQSYGGIDGDSASGAEICCLLSALTGVPIRQDIALTGAVDQMGHIQAIGGVMEKIEGFFDTCSNAGLTGTQGVIIPEANAGELMLRHDVVEACAEGRFHIYAVRTVHEALEILTGVPAGTRDADGEYPEGTLLRQAMEKAQEFWLKSLQTPLLLQGDEEEPGEEDGKEGEDEDQEAGEE